MFPRKLLLILVVTGLLVCGAWLALVSPQRCPVTEEASNRIRKGMTLSKVEAILGGPAGDYRTRPSAPPDDSILEEFDLTHEERIPAFLSDHENLVVTELPGGLVEVEHGRLLQWVGDEGTVSVTFALKRWEVLGFVFSRARLSRPGFTELTLWRLNRIKQWLLP